MVFSDPPMYIRMVDRDIEVAHPSNEKEGTSPLLNRAGSMAESEVQMTSHSQVVDDDMLILRVRMSGDGHTFSVPTRESCRFDEKSIIHQLQAFPPMFYIEICLGLILISSFPARI